jgi:hypothetical protein
MRNILKIVAALAAMVMIAGPASAVVTFDPATGTGFVGKGDVQSAFNLNNAKLQAGVDANKFAFSYQQAAAQTGSQTAAQSATQSATQNVTRVLSCDVTVGGDKRPVRFENDGYRIGTATGTATGSRSGARSGTLSGSLSATIAADPRKTGQWTGWNIRSAGTPTFTSSGITVYGDPTLGDYSWGDYSWGAIGWGDWIASEPGTNPADCLRNDNGALIENLSDVTTPGDIVPGEVTPGEIQYGEMVFGNPTATGLARVFVTYNGVTKGL